MSNSEIHTYQTDIILTVILNILGEDTEAFENLLKARKKNTHTDSVCLFFLTFNS